MSKLSPPGGQSGTLGLKPHRALKLNLVSGLRPTRRTSGGTVLYKRAGVHSSLMLENFGQLSSGRPGFSSLTVHDIRNIGCALRALVHVVSAVETDNTAQEAIGSCVVMAVSGGSVCAGGVGKTPTEAVKRMRSGNRTLLYDATMASNFEWDRALAGILLDGGDNGLRDFRVVLTPHMDADAFEAFRNRRQGFHCLINNALSRIGPNQLPEVYGYLDDAMLGVVAITEPSREVFDLRNSSRRSLGNEGPISGITYADYVVAGAACMASSAENTMVLVYQGSVLAYTSGLPAMTAVYHEAVRQYREISGVYPNPVAALSSTSAASIVLTNLFNAGILDVLYVGESVVTPRMYDVQRKLDLRIVWFERQLRRRTL